MSQEPEPREEQQPGGEGAEPIVRHLEEELERVRSKLRATTEAYEASNEELRASNEALKSKVEELSQANADLHHFMAASNVGMVYLDRDLRIQRYTPHVTKLFNIIPSDRGRPLAHGTHKIRNDRVAEDAARVLDTLTPVEREVLAGDGRWYIMRTAPYRTIDDRIGGVILTFVEFTEHKHAEEALHESDELHRLMVENVREYAIFRLDTEGRVASWNQGAERILGFTEEEILGQPGAVIFTEEDRIAGVPEREIKTAAREGQSSDDHWQVRRDGSRFWASGVTTSLREPDGTLRGFVKILRDLTARREAEQALRESEERLRRTIGIETVGIIFFRTDGAITEANDAFLRMSGYSREDLAAGRVQWDDMTPPEWMPQSLRAVEQLEATGSTTPYEKEYIRKDGSRWRALFAATRLGEEEGAEFIIDITEQKETEEALRRSENRLQLAAETARLGTWELALDTEELATSAICKASFGLPPDAPFSYDDFYEAVHPDDRPRVRQAIRQAAEQGSEYEEEYRILWPDGSTRWIYARGRCLYEAGGRAPSVLSGVTLDVTERRRMEETLRTTKDELEARAAERTEDLVQKNEEVRRLAAALTLAEQRERQRIAEVLHDHLQQLLFGIEMTTGQLHSHATTDEQKKLLGQIAEITDEATTTTRTLSVELSPPVLQGEPFRNMLEWLAAHVKDLHDLSVELHVGDACEVPGQELRMILFQCVRELLFNVVKHANVDRARVEAWKEDDSLRVRVLDEGQGFDPKEPARQEGMAGSFGLAHTRERLSLLGGRLRITSHPGDGTEAVITIPLSTGSPPASG